MMVDMTEGLDKIGQFVVLVQNNLEQMKIDVT